MGVGVVSTFGVTGTTKNVGPEPASLGPKPSRVHLEPPLTFRGREPVGLKWWKLLPGMGNSVTEPSPFETQNQG